MLIYVFVFGFVFTNKTPYFASFVFIGLTTWEFFNRMINGSVKLILNNRDLVTKVYIPKYIFPIAKCLFAGINFLFTLIPLFLIILIAKTPDGAHHVINLSYLLIPVVFLEMLMFTIGISYILSTVTVFLRDVIYIWGIVLTILNYFTPIFYSITILPTNLQNIFKFNPIYLYINSLREIVLFHTPPTPTYILTGLLVGFCTMIIGMLMFRKKQDKFIYYI